MKPAPRTKLEAYAAWRLWHRRESEEQYLTLPIPTLEFRAGEEQSMTLFPVVNCALRELVIPSTVAPCFAISWLGGRDELDELEFYNKPVPAVVATEERMGLPLVGYPRPKHTGIHLVACNLAKTPARLRGHIHVVTWEDA